MNAYSYTHLLKVFFSLFKGGVGVGGGGVRDTIYREIYSFEYVQDL